MKRILIVMLSLFLTATLVGCVTQGRKIDSENASKIQKGVSTKEDVLRLLGKPQSVTSSGSFESWIYSSSSYDFANSLFRGITLRSPHIESESKMIMFDGNVVKDIISISENVSNISVPSDSRKSDSRKNVRDIQQYLMIYGYNPGPADGLMGRKTSSAIRSYQKDNGLQITGTVSDELYRHLASEEMRQGRNQ